MKTDEQQIRDHVEGLFRAFQQRDREAIRAGHTEDWRGFQIKSTALVRGIDQYMQAADEVLRTMRATRHVFDEIDIEVHGDFGFVFYVARVWLIGEEGGEREVPLRSIDVYRRYPDGWNQWASHIGVLPAG